MASFHPMEWAERVLPAADMADGWQLIQQELATLGMDDATFVFGQPKVAKVVPAHARKFGFFLDEEWDRRIHSEPQLAIGSPIASWTKSNAREYVGALERFSAEIHVATTWFCEALRVRELAELTPAPSLSPRERECLLWVQAGHSTKQIGDRLMLGDATVNEYVGGAVRKLDASNRVQAAARAAMLGLIQP